MSYSKGVVKRQMGRWRVTDRTVAKHAFLRKFFCRSHYLLPAAKENNFLIDVESWYSITPRDLADAISQAVRKAYGVCRVLDLFSGVGGNTISFLKHQLKVCSVEYDYMKVKYARYNVRQCVKGPCAHTVVHGDVFSRRTIDALDKEYDVVMACPPWGGMEYSKQTEIEALLQCRLVELEDLYGDRARTRIYMVPKLLSSEFLSKYFNCKVFCGYSNSVCKAHLVVIGETEKFLEFGV
ncbi:hypothetical protein NECID01_1789 [Nematocida sp. AWRm77]|nr:hypothetical protein NECID01_1789 [Nematocida sp. AWRm77]